MFQTKSFQQKIEANDQRLLGQRATRQKPISGRLSQRLAFWVEGAICTLAFFALGGAFHLLAHVLSAYLPHLGDDVAPWVGLMKTLLPWMAPLVIILLARETIAVRVFFDACVITPLARAVGLPLPMDEEQAKWVLTQANRPGSPAREAMVGWLAHNEAQLLTRSEYHALVQWSETLVRLHLRRGKQSAIDHRDRAVADLIKELDLDDEVQSIKQQKQLHDGTSHANGGPAGKRL